MKPLRIILIALLVLYGLGSLVGAYLCLFNPEKQVEYQQLGEMTMGLRKSLILSGSMLLGQVWLYFSTIALLSKKLKQGYMYAVTLGFIELIQAIVIIVGFRLNNFGAPMDYLALVKGILLLTVALIAFKKSQTVSE